MYFVLILFSSIAMKDGNDVGVETEVSRMFDFMEHKVGEGAA